MTMGMHPGVQIHNQHSFIGRNDDGVESLPDLGGGATNIAPINTNFSQLVDTVFRLRFIMTMVTGNERNRAVRLRRNLNGGGYVVINNLNTVVKPALTAFYDHQDDSTEGIIGPPLGFVVWADNTNGHLVEGNPNTGTCNYPAFTDSYIECEFCLTIVGDDVNDGDTIQFRIQRSVGILLDNYLVTPTITVLKPAPHIGVFVKQARIFIPGATKSIISQLIRRRSIFVPGATQGNVFTPGIKQAKVFRPKIVATVKPLGGATQATVYTPGPTQASVFQLIRHQVTFVPGATQGKTFRPGITKSKVFIPGATKGKTI